MTGAFNWPERNFVTVGQKPPGRMETKHNDSVLKHQRKKDQNPLAVKSLPSVTHWPTTANPAQQTTLN